MGALRVLGVEPERGDIPEADDAEVLAVYRRDLCEVQVLGDRDHGRIDNAEGKASFLTFPALLADFRAAFFLLPRRVGLGLVDLKQPDKGGALGTAGSEAGDYVSCERSRVVSWPSAKVTMTLARPPMAPR